MTEILRETCRCGKQLTGTIDYINRVETWQHGDNPEAVVVISEPVITVTDVHPVEEWLDRVHEYEGDLTDRLAALAPDAATDGGGEEGT